MKEIKKDMEFLTKELARLARVTEKMLLRQFPKPKIVKKVIPQSKPSKEIFKDHHRSRRIAGK